MGSNAGLKLVGTYLPEKQMPKLRKRLRQVGKSLSAYLRDLIAAELLEAGVDVRDELALTVGRPKGEPEE